MKGAIFDVDGTLLDSMSVWERITKRFFDKYSLQANPEMMSAFQEMTLQESCAFLRTTFSMPQTAEEIFAEFNSLAEYEYKYNIQMKPFAAEYIQTLHDNGVRLAIATSGFPELCEAALKRYSIWDMFGAIATSGEVGVNKSNPDVYLLAAERIGVKPCECTVYEDIISGIKGAKKAGMRVVGVYDISSADNAEVIKNTADKYILSWKELLIKGGENYQGTKKKE